MKLINIVYEVKLYLICDISHRNLNRTLVFTKKIQNLYELIRISNLSSGSYMIEIKLYAKSKFCGNMCPYLEESPNPNFKNKFTCMNCKTLISLFHVSNNYEGYKCLKHELVDSVEAIFKENNEISNKSYILDSEFNQISLNGNCNNFDIIFFPVQEPMQIKVKVLIVFSLFINLFILIIILIFINRLKNIGE
jgi:hypothetical protein